MQVKKMESKTKKIKEDKRKTKFFRQRVTEGMKTYWRKKRGDDKLFCPRCEKLVNPDKHPCFLKNSKELNSTKDTNIKELK